MWEAERGQSQETGAQSISLMWLAGTWAIVSLSKVHINGKLEWCGAGTVTQSLQYGMQASQVVS